MAAFKRIAFTDATNHQRVFSLLKQLVNSPKQASAVEEFVFDFQGMPNGYSSPIEDPAFQEVERRVAGQKDASAAHTGLVRAVERLGLTPQENAERLQALLSVSPERFSARKAGVLAAKTDLSCKRCQKGRGTGLWCRRKRYLLQSQASFMHHAAALLVALCPNIKTFVLADNSHGALQGLLLKNNYGLLPQSYLQKLRHVRLLHTSDPSLSYEGYYTNVDLLSLFRLFHRLPALTSISADGGDQANSGYFREEFPPATSNVKQLHIRHAAYGSSVLGAIIRIPRGLEELTLATGGLSTIDGSQNMMYPMTLGMALLDHRETLRRLDVDLDAMVDNGYAKPDDQKDDHPNHNFYSVRSLKDYQEEVESERDEWWHRDMQVTTMVDKSLIRTWELLPTREYGSTIGSLHDFANLTHLSIGIRFLVDGSQYIKDWNTQQLVFNRGPSRLVDMLPTGLEHLTLRGYKKGVNDYHDHQVNEFMAQREARYPNLQQIFGVDEMVPNAMNVEETDDDEDYVFHQREVVDDEWVEADS